MSISRKYSRTYHYSFSPGTTSDDRINHQWWEDINNIDNLVHLEKLDGENNCISKLGVFARSHATQTHHKWSNYLKEKQAIIKNDLGDLEVFGENLYAMHSIEYKELDSYFYVFAIRHHDTWLSWEEVKFYCQLLDFKTVPEIKIELADSKEEYSKNIQLAVSNSSKFKSFENGKACNMEGLVTRNSSEFNVNDFSKNVFKWVRKNHVKTDHHWSRNWKRHKLISY
jgi:hypothetical protein